MKKKRNRKISYGFCIPVLALILGCLLFSGQTSYGAQQAAGASQKHSDALIENNVYIGPVDVSGMTQEEAGQAVEAYIEEVQSGTTTLHGTIGDVTVNNADLGLTIDAQDALEEALSVGRSGNLIQRYKEISDCANGKKIIEPNVQIDKDAAETIFEMYEEQLVQVPVNYGLVRENGSFSVTGGTPGTKVDAAGSEEALCAFYASASGDASGDVPVATKDAQPEGSEEELSKVTDVLGTYSTDYSFSSDGRKANIARATELLNGTVVYPGDMISVYAVTGPLDETNGYELAGAYENGTTVQDYGGGICQVSTTLYNAVLYSELEVDERNCHSMIVSYVEPSRDAAIAGGILDFKFTNNTGAPIYIEGVADGATLTYTIYGEDDRDPNRSVDFESEITDTEEAPDGITYVTDDQLALGVIQQTQSPHEGKTAVLWKIVSENGQEVSREQINSSIYKAAGTVYSVGIKSDDPQAVEKVRQAVTTQDEATITQAVSEAAYGIY